MSDMNCVVWRINWTDCLCIILQIVLEAWFIDAYYSWYKNKVSVLKYSLTETLM
jgi:hypothetical protein